MDAVIGTQVLQWRVWRANTGAPAHGRLLINTCQLLMYRVQRAFTISGNEQAAAVNTGPIVIEVGFPSNIINGSILLPSAESADAL